MSTTYVLGISPLDKDSTVALFADERPVYAVAEERLTRVRRQDGFPWRAFDEALRWAGIEAADLAAVAYPFLGAGKEALACLGQFAPYVRDCARDGGLAAAGRLAGFFRGVSANSRCHRWCDRELDRGLRRCGVRHRLRRYDHELCHAAAAYHASGYDEALVHVSDWYGTGSSGGVYLGRGRSLRRLVRYRYPHSLGGYYACFTESLGFVPDLEEGKVLGLAAFGDPSRLYLELLDDFALEPGGSFRLRRPLAPGRVSDLVRRFGAADVAAALQAVFEAVLLASLSAQVRRTGVRRVCLAGGSMANVKLNHRIREIAGVEGVFVFPAMADGGTGYGAACLALDELGVDPRCRLDHVYLSREFTDEEVSAALRDSGRQASPRPDIESAVARLLAEGRIVARWSGRMEFGPRALGNRSILANPADPRVSAELNRMLRRDEFMPFAPSTTLELARSEQVEGLAAGLRSAAYMTMTFNVHSALARSIPAAVHVDGTARFQVVTAEQNPSFHRIIREFHVRTGIPAVLNTSFNLHGEPIVYGPEDALRTFAAAGLDYLALGDFLVGPQPASLVAPAARTTDVTR